LIRSMFVTKGYVEHRVEKRRQQEAKDLDLRRKLTEHNLMAGHGLAATRVEAKRRARSEAAERRELFMDYSYATAQQQKAKQSQIAQFEEYLADELSRRKAEQMRQDMDRRRICDGSEELRSLKERLHVAKVNKERAMQLMQKQVNHEEDRLHEMHIAEHMENERLEHVELEHKLNLEKCNQRERVKVINQQQIAMKEDQRQEALHEYLSERDQVNALVAKIAEEDATEFATRQAKQEETKASLRNFMVEQKLNMEAQELAEREEFEAIEKYAADKRAREAKLAAEKEEQEREKARVLNKMLGQMEARNNEVRELEQLRNDLHLEELEEESRRREEMQMRKKLEDKEEMRQAYAHQMKLKEEKMARERDEEEKIRESLMKKFAEDDRLEQLSEQKRRMKVEAHKREAQRLLNLRREMYEQQRESERAHDVHLRQEEGKRQAIIEEERRRLLAEHGPELMDFLPKFTLETPDDYALLCKRTPGRPPSAGMRAPSPGMRAPSPGLRPPSSGMRPPVPPVQLLAQRPASGRATPLRTPVRTPSRGPSRASTPPFATS